MDEEATREEYAPGLGVSPEAHLPDPLALAENTPLLYKPGDSESGKGFGNQKRKWTSTRAKTMLQNTIVHEIDEATEEDEQVREEQRQFTEIKKFMRVTGARTLTFRVTGGKSVPTSLLRAFEYRTVSFSQRNSLVRPSLYGASHHRPATRYPSESDNTPIVVGRPTTSSSHPTRSSWNGVRDAGFGSEDLPNTMRIRADHQSRKQNTKTFIRPSLVGSLEFRSALNSLHHNPPPQRPLSFETSLQSTRQQHHSLFTIPEAFVAEPSILTEGYEGHERHDEAFGGAAPDFLTSNSNYEETTSATQPAEHPDHDSVLSSFYLSTLFPTMASWSNKALPEKLLAVISTPSVFLLVITCPVAEVVSDDNDVDISNKDPARPVEEADGPMEAVTPRELGRNLPNPEGPKALAGTLTILPVDTLVAWSSRGTILRGSRQDITLTICSEENMPTLGIHRTLSDEEIAWSLPLPPVDVTLASPGTKFDRHETFQLLQLLLGPSLLGLAFFLVQLSHYEPSILAPMIGISCGVCLAAVSWALHPLPIWLKSSLGSVMAVPWIFLLVREAVGVLTAFDTIVGSGDMAIGLSVFAVANSLGDLVADITVARLGYPIMALSACFGGPITQITIGLGFGGLYKILSDQGRENQSIEALSVSHHIPVEFSVQLVLSLATLMSCLAIMLVGVPLNGWKLDGKIGLVLICSWFGAMIANVVLEITAT
ncbi:hypothetical protein RBB50_002154 [Rhinocladiella similis]